VVPVVSLLNVPWLTILAIAALLLVNYRIAVGKGLHKAGADTPAMREAVDFNARAEREFQRAKFRLTRWLTHGHPRGAAIGKIKGPALKAIEHDESEDPAA
jgi:hypothetical protein